VSGWKTARLSSFCVTGTGGTPSRSNLERYYSGGNIPWVKSGELREIVIHQTEEHITEAALKETSIKMVPAGAILLAMYGATVGRLGILGVPATTNQAVCHIIPDPRVAEVRYLFHALSRQVSNLVARGVGGAQPNISQAIVRDLLLPLPPLAEQRRIATILDQADILRTKRRAALNRLDSVSQAIFLDLFGDASTNPKGWPVRPVSDYVFEFQGGKSIEAESSENAVTQNRVLKVSAVTGMQFLPSESKPVPDSYQPPEEHFVQAGDLLFSRANTTELVGAVAYVNATPPNLLLPDKLWRFVWRQPLEVDPLFIWALFQTHAVRREIERRATGTSGSMKNISQEKVFGIATILPPLSLQQDFVRSLAKVEGLKSAQTGSLVQMCDLFASLQHRAFRGEL
jgi:type I restriction enzyme S subunit